MEQLLKTEKLPNWFIYPECFLRIYKQNLLDFDPWIILKGEQLQLRYDGLKTRYPLRNLVPFARRENNDDVACWDKNHNDKIIIIHDFSSSGYQNKDKYNNFWDWLRSALETTIEFNDDCIGV